VSARSEWTAFLAAVNGAPDAYQRPRTETGDDHATMRAALDERHGVSLQGRRLAQDTEAWLAGVTDGGLPT
jgi:hypothetical protein